MLGGGCPPITFGISGIAPSDSGDRLSSADFFVECESDCTSEISRRQFNIFGALEENGDCGISRIGKTMRPVKVLLVAAF